MKDQQKSSVSKFLLGIVALILFHMNLSALTYCNDSYIAFLEADKKDKNEAVENIKGYLEKGAGYFLESYSVFLLFLSKIEKVELEDLNYDELKSDLNNAIGKMEYTKNIYLALNKKADDTPYNPKVINKLINFNYENFQIKNRLIKPVFYKIKNYLYRGRIREMYGERLSQIEVILNIANMIKVKIDAKKFPEASDLYNLNEACSQSLLFDQYAARVFKEIKYNDCKE